MSIRNIPVAFAMALFALAGARPLAAQQDTSVTVRGDSVMIRLVDVDLRFAVQALARYLDRPVVFGPVTAGRVTIETPRAVARADIVRLLRGVIESQSLELVADSSGLYRVRAREAAPPPQPAVSVAPEKGVMELFVVHLRHARAAEVAATVNSLYGRASALGEIGSRSSTLSSALRENQVPPVGAPTQAVISVAGRSANLVGEVVIVPDPGTNSLLIRADRNDFALLDAAIKELDVRPLQVLIEVLIAEVRKDRGYSFGVDASVPQQSLPGAGKGASVGGSVAGLGLGDFALRVMKVGGINLDATLRAAASRGDVTIVSRPVIIAANNESAEILVGSQRPFVQVSRSLATETPSRDQVVQYKDVGTRLTVRPTISADGYVMLDVTQEVNSATTETAFDAPVISTRSVQTRLLIKDGQSVVLGGLADRQRDASQGGIPILSSIPVLGGLFGRTSRRMVETELFLFITPRVIRSDEEAESVSEPFETKARKANP